MWIGVIEMKSFSAKPVIGVCPSVKASDGELHLKQLYSSAIIDSGGIPIILYPDTILPYMHILDGLLLPGGPDIDPIYFSEPVTRQNGEISPIRDAFEIDAVCSAIREIGRASCRERV